MLGLFGLALVLTTGWLWFRLIENVAVPRRRVPYEVAFAVGALLGVSAIVRDEGLVSMLAGGVAAFIGTAFLLLRLQSRQKPNEPAVHVGGPILAFSAPDAQGSSFDLASLTGKPYLLKFFRGHW